MSEPVPTFELVIPGRAPTDAPARAIFKGAEGLEGASEENVNVRLILGREVNEELNRWLEAFLDGEAVRRDAAVHMWSPEGREVFRWRLQGAVPIDFEETEDGDRGGLDSLTLRSSAVSLEAMPAASLGEPDRPTELGTDGRTHLTGRTARANLSYRVELHSVKGMVPVRGAFATSEGLPRDPRERESIGGDDVTEVLQDEAESPLVSRFASGEFTLRMGGFDDLETWAWLVKAQRGGSKARLAVTATVRLVDDTGGLRVEWTLHNLWPIRYAGPGLDEANHDIVLETLTLAHGGGSMKKGV